MNGAVETPRHPVRAVIIVVVFLEVSLSVRLATKETEDGRDCPKSTDVGLMDGAVVTPRYPVWEVIIVVVFLAGSLSVRLAPKVLLVEICGFQW